jgi:hypothetical protein
MSECRNAQEIMGRQWRVANAALRVNRSEDASRMNCREGQLQLVSDDEDR